MEVDIFFTVRSHSLSFFPTQFINMSCFVHLSLHFITITGQPMGASDKSQLPDNSRLWVRIPSANRIFNSGLLFNCLSKKLQRTSIHSSYRSSCMFLIYFTYQHQDLDIFFIFFVIVATIHISDKCSQCQRRNLFTGEPALIITSGVPKNHAFLSKGLNRCVKLF